jgi:fermentation-respiration switch protein FrsA (DUF1100 family)
MLRFIHYLIVAFYVAAPPVAVLLDGFLAWKRARGAPSAALVMTLTASILLGTGLTLIYAIGIGGHIPLAQIFLAIYFAAGLLLLLKCFDGLIRLGLRRLLRPLARPSRAPATRRLTIALAALLRGALLIGVGLPYVMAAIMTYRPKIVPRDDPRSLIGFSYQDVTFESTDGVRLAGWWIPATDARGNSRSRDRTRRQPRDPDFGTKTVIVCHGLAANKANQLVMARELIPAGYNVLAFDFRAHGQSGGQLASFGDIERRDVLGAVRWLRDMKPGESREIFGVGASMGAAALIAAAADDSDEGRAIDAVAVYGTFDDLARLAADLGHDRFLPPFNRLIPKLALPLAGAQTGADLPHFRPAELVLKLWPRPIFVIHGLRDAINPSDRGERLFREAMQPKDHLWLPELDHNQIINDDDTARAVRDFFDQARPLPVI